MKIGDKKMKILLSNGSIVLPDKIFRGELLIEDSKIGYLGQKIEENTIFENLDAEIDCESKYIFPGIIDPHVHLRDMKQKYKETVETGTKAAINNGVTSVFTMSNTVPRLSTPEFIRNYQKKIEKNIYCNVGIYGNISTGFNFNLMQDLKQLGIYGIKIYPGDTSSLFLLDWSPMLDIYRILKGNFPDNNVDPKLVKIQFDEYFSVMINKKNFEEKTSNWRKLFKRAAELNIPILLHTDVPILKIDREKEFNERVECGENLLNAHSQIYSKYQELVHILFTFEILKNIKNENVAESNKEKELNVIPSMRFCHVSCPESVELIKLLSNELNNQEFEIEVSPHHLFLNYSDVNPEKKTHAKVLPPLRSREDMMHIQKLFLSGAFSFIGTDHAPHTTAEKNDTFFAAPAGFPSLDIYVPFFLTKIIDGFSSFQDFVKYASLYPAKHLKMKRKGILEENYDADLFVLKEVPPYQIEPKSFYSKSKLSPYNLDNIKVVVEQVFLDGKLVVTKDKKILKANKILKKYLDKPIGKLFLPT
ncbi:MAG: amidohydrolase family protein [Candidatus Lokiarchaeota archaeon]|nr:amidohydrolase family protein [Candidatus Lokiarchaeota archaeon]